MHTPHDVPIAYSVEGAKKATGLGKSSLYVLMGQGKLEALKAGGKTLITRVSVERYLDSLPRANITTGRRS